MYSESLDLFFCLQTNQPTDCYIVIPDETMKMNNIL